MKKVIVLSLVAAMSIYAAESVEKLDSMSIVGSNDSHANNIIDLTRIETTNSVSNPLNLLNNIAGVHVTTGSSFGLYEYATQVNMRGFNKSQIAFLVDGVPLGSSSTAGGAPVNRFIETENISSVKVFQGSGGLSTPSAAALGGSINYITALPQNETSVKVSTTSGSFGADRIFARMDTGVFGENSRAYISYSDTTIDKWKNEGELTREHIDAKLMSTLGAVEFQLNFSWNNRKDHDYLDITKADYEKYGRDYGLNKNWSILADKAAQTKNNAYNWDTWQNAREDFLVSLNMRADIGNGELKITPYYHDQSGTGNWAPNYVVLADGTKDYTEQSFRQSEYDTQRYGMTINYNTEIGNHELLAGAWLEDGSRQNRRYWYNLINKDVDWSYDRNAYLEQFNREFDTTSLMAYIQTKLHFMDDDLIIDIGAKTQTTSVKYTDKQDSANSQPSKDSNAPFLPQVGLVYKLNSNNQVFTSFAMNYAQLPDSVYTGTDYDPSIQEEESTNIDLGYRYNTNNMALTATLYYINYDNKIEQKTAASADIFDIGRSYVANVGGVESKGIELSALYMLSKEWKFSTTYTYTNAEYTDNIDSLKIKGKQVPFLPENMLNLAFDYSKNGYLFGVNAKFNNGIYGSRDNLEKVDDYTLTNLYIGYNKDIKSSIIKNVNVLLSVNNLFDEDYLATAGTLSDHAGDSTYYVGAPRSATLTLSATF